MKVFTKAHPMTLLSVVVGAIFMALLCTQFVYAQPANMPPPPPSQDGGQPPRQGASNSQLQGSPDEQISADASIKNTDQEEQISFLQRLIELLKKLLGLKSDEATTDIAVAPTPGGDRPAGPPPGGAQGQGAPGGGGGPGGGQSFVGGDAIELAQFTIPESDYYGAYTISDDEYGTEVVVTIENGVRTIEANELPNHETGTFPNDGNPNTISAQEVSYFYPVEPTYTGEAQWVRELGVAVNGVKFELETGEFVQCDSGETYKYEAIQDEVNLGLDFNNAHVQPTGAYHYHGAPTSLTDLYDSGEEISHIGFAADGHYIMYDNTGTLESSYQVAEGARSGTDCAYRGNDIDIDGSDQDGTYVSDWEYVPGSGDLDACNGAFVDGTYVYFVSDDYPYAGRCVQGDLN